MSWINVIPPQSAEGELRTLYQRVTGPDGIVDNVLQIHSLRPHTLEGHMALYKAVLHHRSNKLPSWFLEAIGVLVSRLNGCGYCDQHHTAGMQRLLTDAGHSSAEFESALDNAAPGAPFSKPQQAALGYARQLTELPAKITQDDVESLRTVGLSDGEILEINQVVAYFNYANRTVSGLGVELEKTGVGQSPNNSDNPDDWSHR